VLPPPLAAGSSGVAPHWDRQLDARLVQDEAAEAAEHVAEGGGWGGTTPREKRTDRPTELRNSFSQL
jgi:hypothetical protein